jgi:hypothetical protein
MELTEYIYVQTPFGKGVGPPRIYSRVQSTAITTLYMNAALYATLIFVRMQNCVKWHMDSCLSVQNRQKIAWGTGTGDERKVKIVGEGQ